MHCLDGGDDLCPTADFVQLQSKQEYIEDSQGTEVLV
jgi:hypothetical protein